MSIIAVLTSLGIGGLFSIRNNAKVDAVAEELVSAIRSAQNSAISIKEGEDLSGGTCSDKTISGAAKLWSVKVGTQPGGTTGFNQRFLCSDLYTPNWVEIGYPSGSNANQSPYQDVTVSVSIGGNVKDNVFVYFSAPFGKGYTSENGLCFMESSNISQDYIPAPGLAEPGKPVCSMDVPLDNTTPVVVTISGVGRYSKQVDIKPNGDVYEH